MSFLFFMLLVYAFLFVIDQLYVQPFRRRAAERVGRAYAPGIVSFAISVGFPALAVLLIVRTFVVDLYRVPTPSMVPAIEPGDHIWVNRLSYGIRHPWDGRVLLQGRAPQPGEVIAFRYPREPRTVYVKRLVGQPGDHVQLGEQLSINGQALAWVSASPVDHEARLGHASFRLKLGEPSLGPRPLDFVVPDGHYFVIGDNLPGSRDSRHWGLVSDFHLVGHVLNVP